MANCVRSDSDFGRRVLVTITGDVIMGKVFETAEILMFFIWAQHKGVA